MNEYRSADKAVPVAAAIRMPPSWLRWIALLALCAAYLQGGLVKAMDFPGAVAEVRHLGLDPAGPMAIATIVVELGASLMVLTGVHRWLGALALAAFTLVASFLANRFWQAPPGGQAMMANAFFEHIGLVGGFLLVAWEDRRGRAGAGRMP